jgi:hypothetical protein
MANTATPYGLRPVNLVGGRAFAGATRKLPIESGYSTSIFFGDVVKMSSGYIVKDTGTSTATPIGVFMGCSYMDATYGWTFRQMWTASTIPQANAQPALTVAPQAFICDDPFAVFQIQANGSVALTQIGNNAALVQGSGSTTTGDSAVSANATTASTNTLPLRIIDFVRGPNSSPGDSYTDLLVQWNFGMHQYMQATGTGA